MKPESFQVRKVANQNEFQELLALYETVFAPEKVAELAQSLNDHHPDISFKNWFIVAL